MKILIVEDEPSLREIMVRTLTREQYIVEQAADYAAALDKIAARHHVTIGTFGHAGDGNLHPSILCDKRDKEEFSRVERAVDDLFNVALELGGTLSGEHGIGTSKQKWLELETSKGTLEYMRRMRSAFDPKKLLNASKIVSL